MQRLRISKQWFSLSLINESEKLIHKGSQNDIKLNEFDKFDECFYFSSQYLHKIYNRTEAVMDNTRKFLDKLEADRYSVNQNYKSIPDNAFLREEYIKCGKEFCLRCKNMGHNIMHTEEIKMGKLKKKYIGKNNPKNS